jgi:DnaJ-class molecular chaperone
MAADTDAPAPPPGADRECMACRGTGQVVSMLGGQRRSVECPWCKGTGRRIPGHDAQARWREGGEREGGDGGAGGREGGEGEPEAPQPPDEPEPAA